MIFDLPPTTLLFIVLLLVLTAIWGAGMTFVYGDSRRHRLTPGRRLAWVILAGVPVIGLLLYLAWSGRQQPASGHRATLLQRPALPDRNSHLGTIAALDGGLAALRQAAATTPSYYLEAAGGPYAGMTFLIGALPACLGRGAEATLRLDKDGRVSRQHAELYLDNGVLRLRDLGSTHGTLVNGAPVEDTAVKSGDEIRLGQSLLIVRPGAGDSRQ